MNNTNRLKALHELFFSYFIMSCVLSLLLISVVWSKEAGFPLANIF